MSYDLTINSGKRPLCELPAYNLAFTEMPMDVIIEILFNLPVNDISKFSLASKDIHIMTSAVELWKCLYARDFRMKPPENFSIKTYEDLYKYQSNLLNGVYSSNTITIAPNRPNSTGHCSAIGDGKFFLYSEEFDYFSPDQISCEEEESDEQTNSYYAIGEYMANELGIPEYRTDEKTGESLTLVACRPLIMAWDLKTGDPLGLFAELPFVIEKLTIADGKLLCLSEDSRKLTILDLKTKDCLAILVIDEEISEEGIFTCTASKEKIYIGLAKEEVLVYDLITRDYLNTLETDDDVIDKNDPECSDLITAIAVGADKIFACTNWGERTRICDLNSNHYKNLGSTIAASEAVANDAMIFIATNTPQGYPKSKRLLSIHDWEGNVKSVIPENFNIECEAEQERGSFTTDGNGKFFISPKNLDPYFFDYNGLEHDYSKETAPLKQARDIPVQIWDFKAEDIEIFKEIESKLNLGTQSTLDAIARFLRMPKIAKEKIYEKLCLINAQNGISSTVADIGQELENYAHPNRLQQQPGVAFFEITMNPASFKLYSSLNNLSLAIGNYLSEIEGEKKKEGNEIMFEPQNQEQQEVENSLNDEEKIDDGEWIDSWLS